MSPNDIYRIIRTKADKIHTVINAGDEAVELTDNNTVQIDKYLEKPNFGLPFPWYMYNEYFLGMRDTKLLFEGFLSNEGKTRKLVSFHQMEHELRQAWVQSLLLYPLLLQKKLHL